MLAGLVSVFFEAPSLPERYTFSLPGGHGGVMFIVWAEANSPSPQDTWPHRFPSPETLTRDLRAGHFRGEGSKVIFQN